jgi:hypothetical protein
MDNMTVLGLARIMKDRIFLNTPYRTGNLARNGITDVKTYVAYENGVSAGFDLFPEANTAYGAILNECPTIRYRVTNPFTGKRYSGEYENRHYMWVDKFAEIWANEMPLYVPGMRRIV